MEGDINNLRLLIADNIQSPDGTKPNHSESAGSRQEGKRNSGQRGKDFKRCSDASRMLERTEMLRKRKQKKQKACLWEIN